MGGHELADAPAGAKKNDRKKRLDRERCSPPGQRLIPPARPRFELETRWRPAVLEAIGVHRMTLPRLGIADLGQQSQHKRREVIGPRRPLHQQRKHHATPASQRLPTAGKTGQIRASPCLGPRNHKPPRLHLCLRPPHTTAGEHGIARRRRGSESADTHIVACLPDRCDWNQSDTHLKREIFGDPGCCSRHDVARALGIGCLDRKTCPVTAEHEWKISMAECVHHAADQSGPRHVHGLVAAIRNGLCRRHDVGNADDTALGQRSEYGRVHHPLECVERRHSRIKSRHRASYLIGFDGRR